MAVKTQIQEPDELLSPEHVDEFNKLKELESSVFTGNYFIYIGFILKCYSDEEHAMSVSGIVSKLKEIFPNYLPKDKPRKNAKNEQKKDSKDESIGRRIRDHLIQYFKLREKAENINQFELPADAETNIDFAFHIMTAVLGGTIERVGNGKFKYYFCPLLDSADIFLLRSSIITSRHLTSDEQDFLLRRMETMISLGNTLRENTKDFDSPDELDELKCLIDIEPNERDKTTLQKNYQTAFEKKGNLIDTRNFLNNTNIIYQAIQSKYMISVLYGSFEPENKDVNLPVSFRLMPKKNTVKLNPYALVWNSGHLYLVATHKGHHNPVHYRVDRIVAVKPYKPEQQPNDEPGRSSPKTVSREAIPDLLKKYYQNDIFDQKTYLAEHPLMGAYKEDDKRIQGCVLRTTSYGIALLFDHFGSNLEIRPLKTEETDSNNINEKPSTLYHVKFLDYWPEPDGKPGRTPFEVWHENLLLFCVQNHDMITLIEPRGMREEIKAHLQASIDRLNHLDQADQPEQLP